MNMQALADTLIILALVAGTALGLIYILVEDLMQQFAELHREEPEQREK